ncbi:MULTISPECIES: S8 family serine peptidase [Arthrobacter]|uniref:S8 family serine peptidase n=3 Tax=Arthrobacter TaxID=1663 RepID=A0ABU9KNH1_9MICC|nr:S8 family serine peptidase [Arthrobacter sp. YJM1]MDP5227428.1 S8 family serine peptidase [Arthrobacter sp. YJM1]
MAGALSLALAGPLTATVPAHADSVRDGEYWLDAYGITKAWKQSRGGGVKVAVIDSGIDTSHPDLKGAVVDGTDVSGAGAPDGTKSIGAKPEHGTLVASLLAGRGHGSWPTAGPGSSPSPSPDPATVAGAGTGPDGMIGVAPDAQLLSISTWLGSPNPAGKSDQDQIPEAVRWAVDHGAKVINISLGSSSPDWPQSWDAAFLYAEQKDVVIVAAAGNRAGGNVQVGAPATIPGVVTVAGLDRNNVASQDSSSQGISIAVAAPAEDLEGALPGGLYATWSGTSGAAPIVAGVAALIRSKYPDMSAKQVINRIVSTARDTGAPGRDPLYGFGILDADKALTADVPETDVNPLGSIADWIRVHRRGGDANGKSPADPGRLMPQPSVSDPPVPVAQAVNGLDATGPAAIVLGFGALLVLLLAAAVVHVRRVGRREARDVSAESGSGTAAEEPDTGG